MVLGVASCPGQPTLLPACCLLSGLGWMEIYRLDPTLGERQAAWIVLGLGLYVLVSRMLPATRGWPRYRYYFFVVGLALQLATALYGVEVNGARLWFRVGSVQFQPVEVVKILMVLFLTSFFFRFRRRLKEQQEAGISGLPRGGVFVLVFSGLVGLGVLVFQRDLGMAMLFMGVFLAMFYVAVGRLPLVAVTVVFFAGAGYMAHRLFHHVQVRVAAWLDPFAFFETGGYQMSQALFSLAWGGPWGTGLAQGEPHRIPEVATDFIYVALAEELGLVGAVLVGLLLIRVVAALFESALVEQDEFRCLLLAGIAALLSIQSLIILCGTLKVIPMTGITLPFVSYGGSSMVSNFLMLALVRRCLEERRCEPA